MKSKQLQAKDSTNEAKRDRPSCNLSAWTHRFHQWSHVFDDVPCRQQAGWETYVLPSDCRHSA